MTPRHPDGLLMTQSLWALGGLPPCRVLDMGAGGGESTAWLKALGCDAAGVDLAGGPGVLRADIRQTPFAAGSFDAVLSECVFSVCGDTPAAFAEARRVLARGGLLLLSDLYYPKDAPALSLGRPATRENWLALATEAGFTPREFIDQSAAWRQYTLDLLWASPPDPPCPDFTPRGCGYFLMCCERN